MRKRKTGIAEIVIGAVIAVLLLAMVYPLYYVLIVSVSNGVAIQNQSVYLWPQGLCFNAYNVIFQDPMLVRSYLNSIEYTLVGVAINLVLTILCAYPLSKKEFYGKDFFTVLIVITMFFSGGLVPGYLLVNGLGLVDSMWALILPGAINAWNMFIMRVFFQNLPDSLFQAASIDGANELDQLVKIALPLSLPVIATMLIFYSVGLWNSFFPAMIYINTKEKYPLQIILRNIVLSNMMPKKPGEYVGPSIDVISNNIKYAVIVVVSAPIMLVYPFCQKYFIKGTLVGSLKE